MTYRVEFAPLAHRQIRKLTREVQKRIMERAEQLALDPRPPGVRKLVDELGRAAPKVIVKCP